MGRVARLVSEFGADCDPPTLFLCACVRVCGFPKASSEGC